MPPPRVNFIEEKSTVANAGLLQSILKSVLSPVNAVNFHFLSSLINPAPSLGLVMRTFKAPTLEYTRQFAVSEKI